MMRRGYSTFLLVMGAAFLLMIWAACQQWVNGSIRRRVRIAEAGRRCLMQAGSAIDEGIEVFALQVNSPDPEDAVAKEIARRIREIEPGDVLDFAFELPRAARSGRDGVAVGLERIKARAYILEYKGVKLAEYSKDMEEKLKKFFTKWSTVPG